MTKIVGWIDDLLGKLWKDFVPFMWGLSVGIFIAGTSVTAINFYHLKKDCSVLGVFRIDMEAFACKSLQAK